VQHVVLGLLHGGWDKMFATGKIVGPTNLSSTPFTGSPVKGLALVEHVVHRPHGFFNGCIKVRPVTVNKIHVVHAQSLQGGIGSFDDVFAGETTVVGAFATPENFGTDNQIRTFPFSFAQYFAHYYFGLTGRINLGVVEEINTGIVSGFHALVGRIKIKLVFEGNPGAKRKSADFKT